MKPTLLQLLEEASEAPAWTPEPAITALEQQASPQALELLFSLVEKGSLDGAFAAGRLLARGVSRWEHTSPFAAEFLVGEGTDEPLVQLASRAGAMEFLRDEQGNRWCRVRFPQPAGPLSMSERAAVVQLFTALRERRMARLWVGGFSLPASLSRDVWSALLGPRYGVAW